MLQQWMPDQDVEIALNSGACIFRFCSVSQSYSRLIPSTSTTTVALSKHCFALDCLMAWVWGWDYSIYLPNQWDQVGVTCFKNKYYFCNAILFSQHGIVLCKTTKPHGIHFGISHANKSFLSLWTVLSSIVVILTECESSLDIH